MKYNGFRHIGLTLKRVLTKTMNLAVDYSNMKDMAKKSAIENNLRKRRLAKKFSGRRRRLLDIADDGSRPMEERFEARLRLAAMVLMLLVFFIVGQLNFLAPYKPLIVHQYLPVIGGALAILFVNLFALFYLVARGLFLKETGPAVRKPSGAKE